jgi:hypothetical protein
MKTNLQEYLNILLESKFLEQRCQLVSTQSTTMHKSRLKQWFGCFNTHESQDDNPPPLNLEQIKDVCEKIRDKGIEHLTTDDYLYFIAHQGIICEFNPAYYLAHTYKEVSNERLRRLKNPLPLTSTITR